MRHPSIIDYGDSRQTITQNAAGDIRFLKMMAKKCIFTLKIKLIISPHA